MSCVSLKDEIRRVEAEIKKVSGKKRDRLKEMDFFCLDNSIRESTVGQLRSHTLENKIEIFEQVKLCGIKDIIVASFANMTRIDDDFVAHLKTSGEDFTNLYSFSEFIEGDDPEKIPVALKKNKKYGLRNTIFEIDLHGTFRTIDEICTLIQDRIRWVKREISPFGRVLFNFRDFPFAVQESPERLLAVVKFIACLPELERCFGLMYEDPGGDCLPEELEAWTRSMRRVMDDNGWKGGKLLVHIHQKWDLQTAAQLDCLSAGANGVWASLCEEGAAVGHACSSVTMMNLIRMGNKKILTKYNCVQLRNAAEAITRITTNDPPHPKQCVYGARAVDIVIPSLGAGEFDMAEFFRIKAPKRITTISTPRMIKERLIDLFGNNEQFTDEIGLKMKEKMFEDLHSGRKEEYMSKVGIVHLFKEADGELTEHMCDLICEKKVDRRHHKTLVGDVRKLWDSWNQNGRNSHEDHLPYDSFYNGFLSPYFSCYRCPATKKGLKAILGSDSTVNWKEFLVYVKWALHEYPETELIKELLRTVLEKGLIPLMRDEILKSHL